MKYYLADAVSDPKIIGVKNFEPQVIINENSFDNKEDYDYMVENLARNYWNNEIAIKDLELNISDSFLLPTAKKTDFLRFNPGLTHTQYMVSECVKNIIQKYTTDSVVFFDTTLLEQNLRYKYSLMHVEYLNDCNIDYKNSTFCIGSIIRGRTDVTFSSPEEEKLFRKSHFDLTARIIKLNENHDYDRHMFGTWGGIYMSEQLISELRSIKVSGVNFLPTFDDVNPRVLQILG